MTPPTCATCRFWGTKFEYSREGTCRRRSPDTIPNQWFRQWPETMHDDWCGEHEPKPEKE